MRSLDDREIVIQLIGLGLNDCEISRRTGIPRRTVRDWRQTPIEKLRAAAPSLPIEPSDNRAPAYAYLLGLYLGDGHITSAGRTYRLRVSLDLLHLNVAWWCGLAMETLLPGKRMHLLSRPEARCLEVSMYSNHWPDLFPQHGPGPKHTRPIALRDWQQALVDAHPEQLLRGLVHSDGWRGTNSVRANGKSYAYPRYQFSNASTDIHGIFRGACDRVGAEWRPMGERGTAVSRAASVALLDSFIERKS